MKGKEDNVGCGVLQQRVGLLVGKREYVFSFIFKIAHEYIGKFSNEAKIIFMVNKLCMFYFSVFIILQDVYNQLIINIRSRKRVIRHEKLIILMTE